LIDFVFAGLENNMTISVPGINSSELIVKASVGNITGENGMYKYVVDEKDLKNGEINNVVISILFKDGKGNEVTAGTKTYKIKPIPEVSLKYAGKDGGEVKLNDILNCDSLTYDLPGFFFQDTIFRQILGYTLTIHCVSKEWKKDTSTTKFVISGSKFTMPAAEKLIRLKKGDQFEFTDISVMYMDKPMVLKKALGFVYTSEK
jgi:hypothetical protein